MVAAKLPNWHRIRQGAPLGAALMNCSRTTCAVRFAHLRDLVQQFWLGHRLPDLRAAVGAFIGEVDLRHDPMRYDVLDIHRQSRTAWADNEVVRHRDGGYRLACRLPNKAFSCRPRPRSPMVIRNG